MPLSREEDFSRNNVFSLYDLYGHTLAQEPLPGVMKFKNLVYPSLVIITIYVYLVCLIYAWE